MINTAAHPVRSNRLNECILRRRARNLRAKIRALLPVDICSKHSRRNRNVKDMVENMRSWRKEKEGELGGRKWQSKWAQWQEREGDLYFEGAKEGEQEQRFDKLSGAEIEQVKECQRQIKEDRIYYIGEENIKEFENFLVEKEVKKRQKEECAQSLELLANFLQNDMPKLSLKSRSHYKNRPNRHHTPIYPNNSQRQTQWAHEKQDKAKKLLHFHQRRGLIQADQRSTYTTNKLKMRIKVEKAEANLKNMQEKLMGDLSRRKVVEEQKFKKVQQRRKNNCYKGQIKRLQGELRTTFLSQSPKTVMEK